MGPQQQPNQDINSAPRVIVQATQDQHDPCAAWPSDTNVAPGVGYPLGL